MFSLPPPTHRLLYSLLNMRLTLLSLLPCCLSAALFLRGPGANPADRLRIPLPTDNDPAHVRTDRTNERRQAITSEWRSQEHQKWLQQDEQQDEQDAPPPPPRTEETAISSATAGVVADDLKVVSNRDGKST